jgi:hypothetical protein
MKTKIIQESFNMDPSNFNEAHEYFYVELLYCEHWGFRGGECQNCIVLECDSV